LDYKKEVTKDAFGRPWTLTYKNASGVITTTYYTYVSTSSGGLTNTSNRIACEKTMYGNGTWLSTAYTYDANGNILTVKSENANTTTPTTLKYKYIYDDLGQLTGAFDIDNNKYHQYAYNVQGNITNHVTYNSVNYNNGNPIPSGPPSVQSYYYMDTNWPDKITGTNPMMSWGYDATGNLTSYDGNTLTWTRGRQLASWTNGSVSASYKYNASGLRTQKVTGGTTYNYSYLGSTLTHQTWGSNNLHFYYDENGVPFGLELALGGATAYYFYVRNIQGDIVGIIDSSGAQVVTYEYGNKV